MDSGNVGSEGWDFYYLVFRDTQPKLRPMFACRVARAYCRSKALTNDSNSTVAALAEIRTNSWKDVYGRITQDVNSDGRQMFRDIEEDLKLYSQL